MKRLCALMVLALAASSAQAGTISFSVGGHRIRIEAPRDCRSSSCASISIPGVHESRRQRDDDTRNVVASPPPPAPSPAQVAPPPASAPAPVQQAVQPKPVVAAAPQPAMPAVYKPAATTAQEAVSPPLPPQVRPASVTQPCTMPSVEKPDENVRPTPLVLNVLHQEDAVDSPIGDWQTEGKGMVRVTECGRALCGYVIREGESEKGEAILINMKPKTDEQWSGSVYSRDSGDTYYGTMRLRGPNTLRVEACAFSRFYCNGNNWTRVTSKPMMTSRQMTPEPRS